MSLDDFELHSVIVHDIPRGNDTNEELLLTDAPIELDDELRSYFRRKIIRSLKERGVEIVIDEHQDDTVSKAIVQSIMYPNDLVASSQSIAQRLNQVQTGRNPAGLLAVITGSTGGEPCVSVMKLEREQGIRLVIDTVHGSRVANVELLRDLTLTDKTKVFKTSMFQFSDGADSRNRLAGHVSDDQRGREDGVGVASFFLHTFLGCRLKDSPEKSTLAFAQAFDHFINASVESAERKGTYQVGFLALMQNNDTEIQPRAFADTVIDPDDRPSFFERIEQAGLNIDQAFPKNKSLVKVNGFKMTFDSGMVLVGRQDDLSQRVAIRPDDAPQPGVDINDAVKFLKGR